MASRVGILVIGNEVLSGKVTDLNSTWLIAELRALGRDIGRVTIIPDEVDIIAEQVEFFSRHYDPVFTSGGVGPTHDDKTFEGVARAFGVPLIHYPEMEGVLRRYYGERLRPTHLRMAQIPATTELIWSENLLFPVTKIRNVFVLPGDPGVLKKKFTAIREFFREQPISLRRIFTREDEGDIAEILARTECSFPGLQIGSYPVYGHPDYTVQITLESRDAQITQKAVECLLGDLRQESIFKVE